MFTTMELNKPTEKGCKVLHIKEIWHFERSSDSLFEEYVKWLSKQC